MVTTAMIQGVTWVKSTLSLANGNCVEVSDLPGGRVGVRNSRDPEGPVLRFTPDEWQAFLGGVRWGLESGLEQPRWQRLLISVLSPVLAWTLLLSRGRIDNVWIIGGCIGAFLVQWLFDHHGPDVPARYPKLSTTLTAAACISLAVCLDQAIKT